MAENPTSPGHPPVNRGRASRIRFLWQQVGTPFLSILPSLLPHYKTSWARSPYLRGPLGWGFLRSQLALRGVTIEMWPLGPRCLITAMPDTATFVFLHQTKKKWPQISFIWTQIIQNGWTLKLRLFLHTIFYFLHTMFYVEEYPD